MGEMTMDGGGWVKAQSKSSCHLSLSGREGNGVVVVATASLVFEPLILEALFFLVFVHAKGDNTLYNAKNVKCDKRW